MIGSIENRFLLVTNLLYLEKRSAEHLTKILYHFARITGPSSDTARSYSPSS
jgi:hypothetical protein